MSIVDINHLVAINSDYQTSIYNPQFEQYLLQYIDTSPPDDVDVLDIIKIGRSNNKKSKLLITKSTAKLLSMAEDLDKKSAKEANAVSYITKGFVVANMPHSDPKTNTWIRYNGNYRLCMMAYPGEKIPFGVIPRLFLIWLITEILRTKKKEIVLGNHFNDFLNKVGFDSGGYTRKRVMQQIVWLSRVAIGFFYDDKNISETITPEQIIKHARIWWSNKQNDEQRELFPSTITISDSFYHEITRASIPIDMRIVEALRNSAMKLDIYLWLTFKMYNVKEPLPIKYESLKMQFGSNYDDTPKGLNNFRTMFKKELKEVIAIYPVKVDISSPRQIVLNKSKTSVAILSKPKK